MRSWLTSGAQVVDRRRRFGRHDRTRKLLVVDPQARPASTEGWQSTTAALQRHTVSGALNELEPEHRRVIRLAYLEGHTNSQIAAALGVSVTTAKRRLITALERLEIYISAAGAWLAAVLIFVGARVARVNASSEVQRVASTVTVGALAAAAVGVVTFMPDTAPRAPRPAAPVAAAPVAVAPISVAPFVLAPSVNTTLQSKTMTVADPGKSKDTEKHLNASAEVAPTAAPASHDANGCHGNPTGAPGTPGHPNGHLGPPVDPPGKGGCKRL